MKRDANSDPERILITGAAGFIGARVAEVLHLTGQARVRAGVRRWESAARVGRLPIEIVRCDVTDEGQVAQAMAGVDAVVHCAYGSRAVNVAGTRNVLEAAAARGVRRVVHLSTIEVYGRPEGDVDESLPLQGGYTEYGDSKIEAEEICRSFAGLGLPVIILRPSLVYGPFSRNWTIRYAQLLASRRWSLPRDYGSGICNLVYVDDAVLAIQSALRAVDGLGEAFNVNGPEKLTWREYLDAFADGTGLPAVALRSTAATWARAAVMEPFRWSAKLALQRMPGTVRFFYHRSPTARRLMQGAETAVRTTTSVDECHSYERGSFFTVGKALDGIGWAPRVDMAEGLTRSAAWLRHSGYLSPPRRWIA